MPVSCNDTVLDFLWPCAQVRPMPWQEEVWVGGWVGVAHKYSVGGGSPFELGAFLAAAWTKHLARQSSRQNPPSPPPTPPTTITTTPPSPSPPPPPPHPVNCDRCHACCGLCSGKMFETGMTQGLRAMSCAVKNRYYQLTEMEVSLHNIVQLSGAHLETQHAPTTVMTLSV